MPWAKELGVRLAFLPLDDRVIAGGHGRSYGLGDHPPDADVVVRHEESIFVSSSRS